jgi:C4-dicarboxylate transporter DctM subunit
MDSHVLGIIVLFVLLVLLAMGVPIAIALIVTAMGGIFYLQGYNGLQVVQLQIWESITPFIFTCAPLYILLGALFSNSGMAETLYESVYKWSSRLPGSLAVATTVSCGIFAAISGSSVATAAMFSKVSVPPMLKKGYSPGLASGTVAAGGTLGILIPPSIPFILYGIIAEESIGKLFIAGVLPGIMTLSLFALYTVWEAHNKLRQEEKEHFSLIDKINSTKGIIPFVVVMLGVLGSIYGGVATPTEAAAIGVCFTLLLTMAIYRVLDLNKLWKALRESVSSSAMIMLIIIGAMLLGYLLTVTAVPQHITEYVVKMNIPRWTILLLMNMILILMGMFLEVISIIVITVPILVPIIKALGWDPIWFGVLMVVNMEMALITPPVGLNLYVIKDAIPNVSWENIIKGVFPFIVLLAVSLLIIAVFPQIALWLPSKMK